MLSMRKLNMKRERGILFTQSVSHGDSTCDTEDRSRPLPGSSVSLPERQEHPRLHEGLRQECPHITTLGSACGLAGP